MTPLMLQMLLHYHSVAEPYALRQPERARSFAVAEQRQQLCRSGLLEDDIGPSGFKTTPKGEAYIQELLATPLPTQRWVVERTP